MVGWRAAAVRGRAQCVNCAQVCQDPSSRTRFPEIPCKLQVPSDQ